jgi:tetratricopeptide (TPR) repeat protein
MGVPSRSTPRSAGKAVLAALLIACAVLARAAHAAAIPGEGARRFVADSLRVFALRGRARADSVGRILAPELGDARRCGDRALLARALTLEGSLWSFNERPALALPALEECVPLAAALRDSGLLGRALRSRAYALGQLGRYRDQDRDARRLLALALARADGPLEGIARSFLGWIRLREGRFDAARTELESAAALERRAGRERDEMLALLPLGSARMSVGDFAGARADDGRCLALARRLGDSWMEAQALNDLGVVENGVGDPAAALAAFRAAYAAQRARDAVTDAIVSLVNACGSEKQLGRLSAAQADLDTAFALAASRAVGSEVPWLLSEQIGLEHARGRETELRASARRVLAMGDSAAMPVRIDAALALARSLARVDSTAAARTLLVATRRLVGSLAALADAAALTLAAIDLADRPGERDRREAIALARRLEASGLTGDALAAWRRALDLGLALGADDSARAQAAHALALWTGYRASSRDPEWREAMGEDAAGIGQDALALALREPGVAPQQRLANAFRLAETTRSRTLIERMYGPAAPIGRTSGPSLECTRAALRPDEALLEYVTGPDSCWLFALTRERAAIVRLPAREEIAIAAALARDLVASPPAGAGDATASAAAARRLRERLLGGAAPWLTASPRWIVAPDGPVMLLPFEALAGEPGSRAPVTSRVPSAAVLVSLRSRAWDASPARLLALAGPRAGRPLAAVGAELDDVAWRFGAVERPDLGVVPLARVTGFGVLHVAGHTRSDDERPWLTELPGLVRGARGARAGDIAAARLPLHLAVLSSCESGVGRARAGEGLAGLSTAFLAAGARAVLASLWKVDDRATRRLMAAFYDALADGADPATALALAQRRLASDPATAHPFYWAGFVLTGDGAARVPLAARPWIVRHARPTLAGGIAASALLAGLAAAAGWRRSRAGRTDC